MREDGEDYLDIHGPVKTHEEILILIEEIKAYEQQVTHGIFPKPSQSTVDDLVELPTIEEEFPEWKCIESDTEPRDSPSLLDTKGDASSALKRQRPNSVVKSSIFHLRFDEDGNLINVDLRTSGESPKGNTAKNTLLPKLHQKKETKEEAEESPSKTSMVKTGLGSIGKFKKLIPRRKKESKAVQEDQEEDEDDEDW